MNYAVSQGYFFVKLFNHKCYSSRGQLFQKIMDKNLTKFLIHSLYIMPNHFVFQIFRKRWARQTYKKQEMITKGSQTKVVVNAPYKFVKIMMNGSIGQFDSQYEGF